MVDTRYRLNPQSNPWEGPFGKPFAEPFGPRYCSKKLNTGRIFLFFKGQQTLWDI